MALKGTVATSDYQTRYYAVNWTGAQSMEENKTKISWSLEAVGGESGWYAERDLKVTINGTTVFNKTARVERYAEEIASGEMDIAHDVNGEASITIEIKAAVYYSEVNCTGSETIALDTIPRKSTLTVNNGTLGTEQTLQINKKSSAFTHTVTAVCGSQEVVILTKSSAGSVVFTPPMDWAYENTKGNVVSATYTIVTFSGDTEIGSESYTRSCTIPQLNPTCTLTITDAMGYKDTYGYYIKGMSKFAVEAEVAAKYGAEIVLFSASANGSKYTSYSFVTDELKTSGKLTVSATIKDSRGNNVAVMNTGEQVLDYARPVVAALSVLRCDADGTENKRGAYVKVAFGGEVTSLNKKNTATYVLEYKKTSDSDYAVVELPDYENTYSVSGAYIFKADISAAYNVRFTVTDAFTKDEKTMNASTGFVLKHFLTSGLGLAFGKIAELAYVLDIGLKTRFFGGILHMILESGTNLDDVFTSNTYLLPKGYSYGNAPESDVRAILEVIGEENGEVMQRFRVVSKNKPVEYTRVYASGSWGNWLSQADHISHLILGGTKVYQKATEEFSPDGNDYVDICTVPSLAYMAQASNGDYSTSTAKIIGTSLYTDSDGAVWVRVHFDGAVSDTARINYIIWQL